MGFRKSDDLPTFSEYTRTIHTFYKRENSSGNKAYISLVDIIINTNLKGPLTL